jgi:topoisomerase IV subunit B
LKTLGYVERRQQIDCSIHVKAAELLGEMMPAQLKETTMDPAKHSMLRVVLLADDRAGTADSVERLMGTKAEARFAFISDKAEFASEDLLDV